MISASPLLIKKEKMKKMQISKKLSATLVITLLTISAIMAAIPMASAAITAAPTLDVTTGPVGTAVTVTGAAGDAAPFSTVTAYWDALSGIVLGSAPATSTGSYEIDVKIPKAVNGGHFIVVNDGGGAMGAAFTVTAEIKVSANAGLPGDAITVTGTGFAASSDITLTFDSVTLTTPVSVTLTAPAITTNGTGSFSASIVIPTSIVPADYDDYTLTAEDEDTNTASVTVAIDYNIKLTPDLGPTGISTTISGRIEASVAYDITFNGAPVASGTSGADGSFSASYTIPGVLSTGSYPVEIVWATINSRSATFQVTASPTIALSVATGIAGDIVTVTGSGFSSKANITLTFGTTVVNSTAMNAAFGPTTTGGALPANLKFVVPTLAPAVYAVKVVDQYMATSTVVYFTITATPVTTIALRGTSYYPGDTISFNIYTTDGFTAGPVVTIRDPTGATWWTNTWPLTASGASWSVLYQDQLFGVDEHALLPADAPLGSWNWTISYTGTTLGAKTATGLFSVVALPNMQNVLDALTTMDGKISGYVTTSEGKIIAAVNTKTGTIMTDLSALMPKLQGIEDTAVIIATMLGDVQVDLANLDMSALASLGVDITSIKGDVATIKTNIGTVSTSVSALDAKVTSVVDVGTIVGGDIATVQTTLGTLEGKITSIDGKIATVQTSVGALQADVTGVTADLPVDMMPVWIAVVLSLVAAIAAIFAVITIRQKIAG